LLALVIVIAVIIITIQIYLLAIYTWFFSDDEEVSVPTTIHGMPTTGSLSATFHSQQYFDRFGVWHTGVDFANAEGTPIYCTSDDAQVVLVGFDGSGYGHYIKIRDRESDWTIIFAHLRQASHLRLGDDLDYGELIGYMGNTGNSFGNHLHYEIRDTSNTPVDPDGSEGCCQ